MDLLSLCLISTYFQYNRKHYKQLHGKAMGSLVSVVVAEIVMQNIEEPALATFRQTILLWLRYFVSTITNWWSTMTNEHLGVVLWASLIDRDVSVFIFYNISFSQLSYFVSNRADEKFSEYFSVFRSVFTTNVLALLRSQLWNILFDHGMKIGRHILDNAQCLWVVIHLSIYI